MHAPRIRSKETVRMCRMEGIALAVWHKRKK
jgi:hypothetical protein